MSKATIDKILYSFGNETTVQKLEIIWHGGEPLLASIDFYRQVLETQKQVTKETGLEFANGMQSNLIGLTEEFADFLVENKFDVSTSIDGPMEIHDAVRCYRNGDGTFKTVMKNRRILLEKGMNVGVVAVITRQNIDKLEEIYNFFKANDINVDFLFLIPQGRAEINSETYGLKIRDYSKARIKLFDLWFEDSDKSKTQFDSSYWLTNLLLNTHSFCNETGECQKKFVGIAPNGDFYPCNRLMHNKDFFYGNIHKSSLSEILNHPLRVKLGNKKELNKDHCSRCEYFNQCHSGGMCEAFYGGDETGKTRYCAELHKIYNHIKEKVSRELVKARIQ
jgi:uncharacterized protein